MRQPRQKTPSDGSKSSLRSSLNLASAMQAVATSQGQELTLGELVRAHASARLDGSDLRLKKWTDALGARSAWSITAEELELAAAAMREHGYAPASVNRDLSAMGSVYRWAKAARLNPRGFKSPTLGVRRFEEPIRRVHVTSETLEKLRARSLAFQDRRFGVFVHLLIDTGARKSELTDRYWADVHLEERQILAPTTKNGTPRVLFFSERTEQLIRRVYAKRDADHLVFEGKTRGQAISFRRAWGVLVRDVGVPDLHMHDIRTLQG